MRLQRRMIFTLLAVCLLVFCITSTSWDAAMILSNHISHNPFSSRFLKMVTLKNQSSTLYYANTLAHPHKGSEEPASGRDGHNLKDVKSYRIEELVTILSKLARIPLTSRLAQSMRAALLNLSRVPELESQRDQEKKKLTTVVPPPARILYNDTWLGLTLPVITCTPLGRLGNIMGEYATMFALHRIYNASVVIHKNMRTRLKDFRYLSLPDLPGTFNTSEWRGLKNFGSLYNYAPIELAASGLLGPQRFVMREYAFEIQLFQKFRKELKREFAFSDETNLKVREFLSKLQKNSSSTQSPDLVFIGIHIRRTDYLKHASNMFGARLPEDAYFNRAMEYYRAKLPGKVVFIAASDDPTYVKSTLGKHPDVHLSPGTSPTFDMALLSSCNHSIVTLGSFGFWTGFLTGGEVVYPDVTFKKEYRFSRYMYEKIGLQSFTPLPVN